MILGFITILKKCQASSKFEAVNSTWLSSCQRDVTTLFEIKWRRRAFCRVSTGDSDILSSCDMIDEHAWRFCREIWTSFYSGHLGVHFAWSIKHRVPLTYIFLREKSSWGACGMMAYLFSRRQGISSHLQMIWGAWIFHPVALLKLMFLMTWDGCLRESLDYCKGCQATCCIWCGMRDGYGFSEGEMCFILSWFGVHQSILHSWCDISVLLLLWQYSWVFSSVASGKSRFLTSLIGNMELLSKKCTGIGPHLAARGKSHEFSRVAAGTWCIFSSYGGDGHLKLGFVERSQDSCLVMTDTSGS